jgi:hypothetical protein
MPKTSIIKTVIIGNLANEYIINVDGKAANRICGGSLLYAAAGAKSRISEIGLLGRCNPAYPPAWLQLIENSGFDSRGILKTSNPFDDRRFFAWRDAEVYDGDNPVAHFASHGLTFPHELLGYHIADLPSDDSIWTNTSGRMKNELPPEYFDITSAHICALDFSTQVKAINLLESGSINTYTLSPSAQYMKPDYIDKLQVIVKGAAAFYTTEVDLSSLCHLRTKDIWEMIEIIVDMGCQRVVVSRGVKGYLMYDADTQKRHCLPIYPTRWIDPTGVHEVFAGAFLGEYKESFNPEKALVHGCVMASLAAEGTGPFYILDALPGLADARAARMNPLLSIV